MGSKKVNYTCGVYREEMILLGLKKRLHQDDLSENERKELILAIELIEKKMGM